MTDSPKSDLRFIYISDDVWLNLKKQAVLEGNSVSKIVRTVIEAYFENPFNVFNKRGLYSIGTLESIDKLVKRQKEGVQIRIDPAIDK